MGRRRVGTLSMAVLLIASGIMLLIAQVNKQPILDIVLKGWPLILFLLGGEILWYCYKVKDENAKIRYDLFSVFIICIILVFHLSLYGLIQLDVVSKLDLIISSKHFVLKTPVEEFTLNNNIQKIVIDAVNFDHLTIRTNEENKITAYGSAQVTADTKETAEKLLNSKNMVTHQSGNTLYISLNQSYSGNDVIYHSSLREYTLIIPSDKKVEINNVDRLDLLVDAISNDWLVDGCYDTEIRLGTNVNVKINASVESKQDLKGNITWVMDEPTNTEEDAGSNTDSSSYPIKGEIIQGSGQHQIHILNTNNITVNNLI